MSNSVTDLLTSAKGLIDAPHKWNQGAFARDGFNVAVAISDPRAKCFCALGALLKASGYRSEANKYSAAPEYGPAKQYLHAALLQMQPNSISRYRIDRFNDYPGTAHADVMALYDRAIQLSERPLYELSKENQP